MRKKRKTYTGDEIRDLNVKLRKHRGALWFLIGELHKAFGAERDFDTAVELRDKSQLLTATCLAIKHVPTLVSLADHEPQMFPYLDECGLDEGATS